MTDRRFVRGDCAPLRSVCRPRRRLQHQWVCRLRRDLCEPRPSPPPTSRSNQNRTLRLIITIEILERETGIEPATSSLGSWRSTAELLPLARSESNHSTQLLLQHPGWWRTAGADLPDL